MVDFTGTSGVEPATGPGPDRRQPDHEQRDGRAPREPARRTPRDIQDVAQMMGIPAAELTPRVQEALDIIVNEYDRVRSELEREHERVARFQDLADHHPLLPTLNHHAFLRELGRLINRARQTETVSTVALFHIRGLDAVRLERGREAAEGIRERISRQLADNLRASDLLAALGEGDFAVILTLTESTEATDKGQALAEGIRSLLEEIGGRLSVFWGIRTFAADDDARQVLKAADADLRRRAETETPLGSTPAIG